MADWGSAAPAAAEDEQPVGLRERKKLATRQALGFAAMRLAVQHGVENVLVEDIAEAAGVSARTFNNYFGSKYEAICSLGFDRALRVGAALRERPADEDLWQAITGAVMSEYGAADQPLDPEWMAGDPGGDQHARAARRVSQGAVHDPVRAGGGDRDPDGAAGRGQHVPAHPVRIGDLRHPGRVRALGDVRSAGRAGADDAAGPK